MSKSLGNSPDPLDLIAKYGADSVRYQRASSVAALGKIYWEQGRAVPAAEFAPVYLRLSQAERERKEALAKITCGN